MNIYIYLYCIYIYIVFMYIYILYIYIYIHIILYILMILHNVTSPFLATIDLFTHHSPVFRPTPQSIALLIFILVRLSGCSEMASCSEPQLHLGWNVEEVSSKTSYKISHTIPQNGTVVRMNPCICFFSTASIYTLFKSNLSH